MGLEVVFSERFLRMDLPILPLFLRFLPEFLRFP